MATSETPRDHKNHLARKSLLMAKQLEHHHAQQREAYRLHTKANSSEQADYQCNTRRGAYMHHIQQKHASNAACMQMYNTATVGCYELGSMNVECSHCYALY
ncbi:19337_t:CDS:1 [Gigaspora margarita]|uniref:19337_t:CDS:1 n=1 Tax=Gigaspora margarita TaxID=4874 RepID=A0ABN7V4G7_GIGMA|nr:19337_t:CDS:1 [Gigaspora margarita]